MSERLIGIDLDGTLEDSRDDMVAVARRVRASLELPGRPEEALREHVNGGMDALYRACFDDYLGVGGASPSQSTTTSASTTALTSTFEERYAVVRERYEADYLAHVAVSTRLYEGIGEALRELSALGRIACVTNKPERISRRLLEVLGVGELFTTVIGGDSGPHIKPHPSMLQLAAQRCRLSSAADSFMIGDTAGDIQLGRAYGARTIFCAWGYVRTITETPDFRAERPADLPRLVRA